MKQAQFGADQVWRGGEVPGGVAPKDAGLTNGQRLLEEINDFLAIVKALVDREQVPDQTIGEFDDAIEAKTKKLEKYLKFSQELGMVGDK